MKDWEKITKQQFDAAYNKHLPNAWIKFAFKYFSKDTVKSNLTLKNNIAYFLIVTFLIGFIGTIFNAPRKLILITTIVYSIILVILVLYLFSAAMLNNFRIKKIQKELGVTNSEYNELLFKFNS